MLRRTCICPVQATRLESATLKGIAFAVLLLGGSIAAAEEPQLEVVRAEFGLFNALDYRMRVSVEGKLVRTFEFRVE